MGPDPSFPHHSRVEERSRSFQEIRHHPQATYDTVSHIVKRMWDMEAKAGGASPPAGEGSAWQDLRGHLELMLGQAIEFLPDDRPEHSVHDEWQYEHGRDGASGSGSMPSAAKAHGSPGACAVHDP